MPKIVLYGAGSLGRLTHYALNGEVDYFCDSDKDKQGTIYCGTPVISPNKIPADARVIICNDYMEGEDCINYLEGVDFSGLNLDAERIIGLHKADIKCVDVVITERCSMRCKDCSNLMGYYDDPQDCDLGLLFESLDKLQCVDIYEYRVIGGEPLVSKDIYKVVDKLKGKNVVIYTNGTIVPDCSRLKGVKFDITNYGHKNHDKLVAELEKYSIEYTTYIPTEWTDSGKIWYHYQTKEQRDEKFANCCVRDVMTLLNGKLYHCPFSAHFSNLNKVYHDCVEFDKEKIVKFYNRKEHLTACKYCKGRDYSTPKIQPAIQRNNPRV